MLKLFLKYHSAVQRVGLIPTSYNIPLGLTGRERNSVCECAANFNQSSRFSDNQYTVFKTERAIHRLSGQIGKLTKIPLFFTLKPEGPAVLESDTNFNQNLRTPHLQHALRVNYCS